MIGTIGKPEAGIYVLGNYLMLTRMHLNNEHFSVIFSFEFVCTRLEDFNVIIVVLDWNIFPNS